MLHQTSVDIENFYFHDCRVIDISNKNNSLVINLECGHILKNHPLNSKKHSTLIQPCSIEFVNVIKNSATVNLFSNNEIVEFLFDGWPIDDEIMELVFDKKSSAIATNIKGFNEFGFSEWNIECSNVVISWNRFGEKSWFENWS